MNAFLAALSKAPICHFLFMLFLLTHFSFLLSSPPGMTCPTSCTVRAEFLSSVLTRMTPWLRPPMERMARAGRGVPGTPGLHRREQTWAFPSIPSVLTASHLPTHPCTPPHTTDYINIHPARPEWSSVSCFVFWEVGGTRRRKWFLSSFVFVFFFLYGTKTIQHKKEIWVSDIPAYSDCHGLRGGGTGTDDLRFQPVGLKHIQEGITGRHRPLGGRERGFNVTFNLCRLKRPSFYKAGGHGVLTGVSTISNNQHT